MDQDLPRHVQAEPIEKPNSLEKEPSEINAKIDIGEMELFEDINNVSSNDGNDTDSSFGAIGSENEVKNLLKFYFNIR